MTVLFDDVPHQYDAVLVVSFGGPEGPDDVMPFLENVFRGIPVTEETKTKIAERYARFGGVSPINSQTSAFIDALRVELDARGPSLPIYWGNRNWHPLLDDAFRQMCRDGVRRAIAYVTSTFSSYSGCRKYRENLYDASRTVANPPAVDRLRSGYNHPGFIEAAAERVGEALQELAPQKRDATTLLFTAHSLPLSMARHSPYEAQLDASCRLVGDALEHQRWRLVYQSNNARYGGEPWLEPDIGDALVDLAQEGMEDVVVSPIGFISDHLEVVLDLDIEAAAVARKHGLNMIRAGTVGTHPAFISMVRDLICERMAERPMRRALGSLGPAHDFCPPDCCLSGGSGPVKPTLGGSPTQLSDGE